MNEPVTAPRPGGFPVSIPHNALMGVVQMYSTLLSEQEKRIEILASQLAIEQRERLRLTKENTELRMALQERNAAMINAAVEAKKAVVASVHAPEDQERLASDERGRHEGAEPG